MRRTPRAGGGDRLNPGLVLEDQAVRAGAVVAGQRVEDGGPTVSMSNLVLRVMSLALSPAAQMLAFAEAARMAPAAYVAEASLRGPLSRSPGPARGADWPGRGRAPSCGLLSYRDGEGLVAPFPVAAWPVAGCYGWRVRNRTVAMIIKVMSRKRAAMRWVWLSSHRASLARQGMVRSRMARQRPFSKVQSRTSTAGL